MPRSVPIHQKNVQEIDCEIKKKGTAQNKAIKLSEGLLRLRIHCVERQKSFESRLKTCQ